ncbi:MAG: hypothetical protein ACODAU_02010 [Myxococcota bacterium]
MTGAGRLAGSLVVDQRETLRVLLGDDGYGRVLDAVPREAREEYEQALGVSWVPTEVVDEVVRTAARYVGRPLLEFHSDLTRRNLERTLRGIWRVLLRFTSDQALIQRTPVFYRKSYDTGALEGSIPEPGHAVSTLRGYPGISDVQLTGLRVGIETVLSMAGRLDVRGRHRRTADGAVIDCFWAER